MEWLLNDPTVVAGIAALKAAVIALAGGVLLMLARLLWGVRPQLEALFTEWMQNIFNDRLAKAAERSVAEKVVALGRDATPEKLQEAAAEMAANLTQKMPETLAAAKAPAGTAARFVASPLADKILAAKAAETPPVVSAAYELGASAMDLHGLPPIKGSRDMGGNISGVIGR